MQKEQQEARVFISYAREDAKAAHTLYQDLIKAGLTPWLDIESLLPGQNWRSEIKKAIRNSRYYLPLFSSNSAEKRGDVQREFKYSLEVFEEIPESVIFVIPVRLDDCKIPYEKLKDIEYVDLFPRWEEGIRRILQAMGITETKSEQNRSYQDIREHIINSFELAIEERDVAAFNSDVIALKYAQSFYGADLKISKVLEEGGIPIDSLRPLPNKYCYVKTVGSINARFVFFIGVLPLQQFTYKEIREFATRAVVIVSKELPHVEHIAMTIHGPGYGLDEVESFLAQLAGLQDAMLTKRTSNSIKRISIVDRNHERVQRLRNVLQKNLASVNYAHKLKPDGSLYRMDIVDVVPRVIYGDAGDWISTISETPDSINSAGFQSESKPHVFVAMPFRKDMEDVFYLGIQEPAHGADLLCERIDNEAFTGDILEQVKKKIETAAVVIAELTGANPNVYLEIGYAWGKGLQTILLVKEKEEVKFDVTGQRHLRYTTIMDLRKVLSNELKQLKFKGLIK